MPTSDPARPYVLLANGNLNGRVLRLLADELRHSGARPVRVVSTTALPPLVAWPEERERPHAVAVEQLDPEATVRRVREAAVFVLPPFWDPPAYRLIAEARRAGVPVVCVFVDVGYGVRKLEPRDRDSLPDLFGVGDPVTRDLLTRLGIPTERIRATGSLYFDSLLAAPLPPAPPAPPLRIGILANPNGLREALADHYDTVPEGVVPAVVAIASELPGARVTVRLHPRQDPGRIRSAFPRSPSLAIDRGRTTTLREFLAAHHVVVGSYSMGLLAARLLGRASVSFQPRRHDDGLRREVFAAWDVPVAASEAELATHVAERLAFAGPPLALERILYRPRRSRRAIAQLLREAETVRGSTGAAPAGAASVGSCDNR